MKNQTLATRTQGDEVTITGDFVLEDFDWSGVEATMTLATSQTAAPLTKWATDGGETEGTVLTLTPEGDGRVTLVAEAPEAVTRRWPTTTLVLKLSFYRSGANVWGPYTLGPFYLPVVPQPFQ